MFLRSQRIFITFIVLARVGFSQEPEAKPCVAAADLIARSAGSAGPNPTQVVTREDLENLAVVSVAELAEALPNEIGNRDDSCGPAVEVRFGGLLWLVSECARNSDVTILSFDPAPGNSTVASFWLMLSGGRCGIGAIEPLDAQAEQAHAQLLAITRSALDQLLEDVRTVSE